MFSVMITSSGYSVYLALGISCLIASFEKLGCTNLKTLVAAGLFAALVLQWLVLPIDMERKMFYAFLFSILFLVTLAIEPREMSLNQEHEESG